jgi:hypothetical protein
VCKKAHKPDGVVLTVCSLRDSACQEALGAVRAMGYLGLFSSIVATYLLRVAWCSSSLLAACSRSSLTDATASLMASLSSPLPDLRRVRWSSILASRWVMLVASFSCVAESAS